MKKMTRNAMALAAGTTMAAAALAADPGAFTTSGYFRAGTGTASKGDSRACYGLAGAGLKYRLGNECDIYGEIDLATAFKADDTVEYSVHVMPTLWNPGTDNGSATWGLGQMYVEGKGFDFAPGVKFWAGKRYYGRTDIHINDTKYTVEDGVGGGAYGIDLGVGKLGVAYFRDDGDGTTPMNRFNVELGEIGVNAGGKLRFVTAFTSANFEGGKSGAALTVQHDQSDLFGGGNTVWLQYAQGSANLNTNFGNATAGSDVKGWRLTDALSWQVGAFGGQAMASYAQNKADAGDSTMSTVGGRVSYALTKNFKLVTEAGYSQLKPEGQATQKLAKLTIAPTIAAGPGFWNRPELRLYATSAKWNDAAGANTANGLPAGKTSGTSVGVQVEMWW